MPDYIYVLLCPQGEIRYVGKTNHPHKRLRQHISAARTGSAKHHCARWIRSLLRNDSSPTMEVLYQVPEGEDWKAHEVRQIKAFKDLGFSLTNVGEGGEGSFDMRPEAVAERVRKALITKSTPEYKEKVRGSYSLPWKDPAIRASRLAAMAAARERPGHRERRVAASKEIAARPEVKAKRSSSQKASYASGNRINSLLLPCVTAKRKAGIKERWAKPEEKDKVREALLDPARQALMQAAANSPEAKAKRAAKIAITQATPEFLENQAAKARAQWQDPNFLEKRRAILDARHAATHTPEHLAKMRDRRNEAKRRKRAEKAAMLAAAPSAPYTESS